MGSVVLSLLLAVVLLAGAVLKLAGGARARAALATYGLRAGQHGLLGRADRRRGALAVGVGAGVTPRRGRPPR